jgi:hypothetical protein
MPDPDSDDAALADEGLVTTPAKPTSWWLELLAFGQKAAVDDVPMNPDVENAINKTVSGVGNLVPDLAGGLGSLAKDLPWIVFGLALIAGAYLLFTVKGKAGEIL